MSPGLLRADEALLLATRDAGAVDALGNIGPLIAGLLAAAASFLGLIVLSVVAALLVLLLLLGLLTVLLRSRS